MLCLKHKQRSDRRNECEDRHQTSATNADGTSLDTSKDEGIKTSGDVNTSAKVETKTEIKGTVNTGSSVSGSGSTGVESGKASTSARKTPDAGASHRQSRLSLDANVKKHD